MPSNAPDSIRCGDTVAITRDGARRLGKRRFTFPNCVDLWVRICVIFRNSLTGNIVFVCFERGKVEPLGVRRKTGLKTTSKKQRRIGAKTYPYFVAIIKVVPGRVFGTSSCISMELNPAFFSHSEYCDSVQHSPSGV